MIKKTYFVFQKCLKKFENFSIRKNSSNIPDRMCSHVIVKDKSKNLNIRKTFLISQIVCVPMLIPKSKF